MRKVHFIAIGGQGMSGIARILIDKGFEVSGSDLKAGAATERLQALGARVFIGHRRENIDDPDIVIVSSAISEDNPEVEEARRRGIPVVHRMDMLLDAINGKKIIGVAGAHGKTTTSAMIAWILEQSGAEPTYLVGGEFGYGGNARLGNGAYAVVETDESDGSFLKCRPQISVVTNIDNDHLDFWGSLESLEDAFYSYLEHTGPGGLRIVCTDNELLRNWALGKQDVVSYGVQHKATWQAVNIVEKGWHIGCQVSCMGTQVADIKLDLPGIYNLQNALGAVATAVSAGIDLQDACNHIGSFPGVKRRLERIGEYGGVLVLDDFAHHPNEIVAALGAIRKALFDSRVVVLFQPHRYSRTRLLHHSFGSAFREADVVIVTRIYTGPGEREDSDVDSDSIKRAIQDAGHQCVYKVDGMKEASLMAANLCRKGDTVVTMGAGDIWKTHHILSGLLGRLE
jgi:UDP-N-acetylmuramate--alanine ligase